MDTSPFRFCGMMIAMGIAASAASTSATLGSPVGLSQSGGGGLGPGSTVELREEMDLSPLLRVPPGPDALVPQAVKRMLTATMARTAIDLTRSASALRRGR